MTAINAVTDLTREGDIAVITINSPPVNALSADVRNGLRDGVQQAAADPAVKAIVVICAGRTFIAGADISEFGKPTKGATLPEIAGRARRRAQAGHRRHARHRARRRLRNGADVPLSRGGAIGKIRPARDQARSYSRRRRHAAPAALERRRERARDAILSGTPFGAKQALEWGVVDTLVEEGKLREGAMAFARKVIDTHMPLRKIRDLNDKIEAARGKPEIFDKIRRENARKYPRLRGLASRPCARCRRPSTCPSTKA